MSLYIAASSPAIAQQQQPALSAPTNLEATISALGVTLSWTAPDGLVSGYEILRRRPRLGETDLATLVDNTGSIVTSYTDTSATEPDERYIYRLKTIRGSDRSDLSLFVQVDYPTDPPEAVSVSVSCEILTGDNHNILYCMTSAGDLPITSAQWTPDFEVQYAQTTSGPTVSWVIADEYCGQSTTIEVGALTGSTALPAAETTITLECAPEPADTLTVSCEDLIENSQHKLSCALSGGDETITSAQWTPQYDTESAQTTEEPNATEATWVISAEDCGQTTSMTVIPQAGETTLPTVETTFSLACVINVDDNCSLANAIRSANGNAQVEESGDSDGNDDCETGADPDDTADPPETGDDIILLKQNVTLTAPLPSITSRIRIEGNGRTISGDAKHRVLMVVDGHLSVKDLTITKGLASTVGGGIYVNSGSLSVSDSTIKINKASDIGGGIYAIDSDVDIADTEFSENMTVKSHGGAVYFVSSSGLHTLDIVGSTFKKNMATEDGGALKTAGGIATINKSTFVENQADEGGAIESSQTTLDITNSTFSNNSAREGGGLSSFSSFVTLTHTTWAYNSAEEQGGGIAIIGWTGNFKIRNTLITGSKSGGDCHSGPNPNIILQFTGNLIQDGSCTPEPAESQAAPSDSDDGQVQAQALAQQVFSAEAQASDEMADPKISRRLVGNPPHYRLQWGSPAIDAADPMYCSRDDQPDTARPQYGNCDIGAYEYPRSPNPPSEPPEEPTDEPPDETPTPETPTPEPEICPVNDRIIVRSPYDDMECEEIDTITLDKHPSLQGIRFAMRLWRYNRECTHVVADGENLYRLALRYDTSMQILRRHNNLATDVLSVGQTLLLPSCEPDAVSFDPVTEVCFEAQGRLALIDTATPERTIHAIASYESQGMTCGQVDRPGIVVLVASDSG
ncbi:MAG: LysM peptidoglycan-binding domain-containing protein [Chloroflexi bacterium]|nr:LysM peptidoglycan-binding domain-containing protein [Chloroflexota bacterium]